MLGLVLGPRSLGSVVSFMLARPGPFLGPALLTQLAVLRTPLPRRT